MRCLNFVFGTPQSQPKVATGFLVRTWNQIAPMFLKNGNSEHKGVWEVFFVYLCMNVWMHACMHAYNLNDTMTAIIWSWWQWQWWSQYTFYKYHTSTCVFWKIDTWTENRYMEWHTSRSFFPCMNCQVEWRFEVALGSRTGSDLWIHGWDGFVNSNGLVFCIRRGMKRPKRPWATLLSNHPKS